MNVVEEVPLLKVLLSLFYSLRQYGLPLGVEDYMLVLRALQGGFGIGDRDSLERLCCTLWTKSEQEARLLHQLLGRAITNAPSSAELPEPVEDTPNPSPTSASTRPVSKESEEVMDSSTLPSTATPVGNISEQLEEKAPLKEPEIPVSKPSPLTDIPLEIDEPELVIQAIRHYNRSNEMISEHQDLAAQYLPVTPRQIKQSWRFLSRSVPQGISDKLNVPATVAKICQQCILIEAVLMPNYVNRVKLVLLVDQGGSMIPFHHLSRQLIDKARRGGNIEQASVYYFYNYPEIYFYSDPTRLKAQLITDILGAIDERAGVLMVSDAGAARSNYNPERIECTQRFIEQLRQSVRYYAWLNPMPNDSWQGTTAGEIARFVPMFEMSPQGFNAAINALRGRYVRLNTHKESMLSDLLKQSKALAIGKANEQEIKQIEDKIYETEQLLGSISREITDSISQEIMEKGFGSREQESSSSGKASFSEITKNEGLFAGDKEPKRLKEGDDQ